MLKISVIIFICCIAANSILAQPQIRIEPRNIVFEDIFNRIDYAYVINQGNQPLRIDSLSSANPFYIVSFENGLVTPFFINPDDTVKASILLTNFYNITVSDTVDTLWFFSNDPESPRDLRIKIDFFDDDDRGICSGVISDEQQNLLSGAKVYFLYWGIYIIDSTSTDTNGYYSLSLPKGNYTLAAEKEGYQTTFYGNTFDPYIAYPIEIDSGQTVNLNLQLPFIGNTGYSISGSLLDSAGNFLVNKGVVVIRKGTHTPTLLKGNAALVDSNVYSAFVRPDGSYSVTVRDTSYYYVQGFSDYYLPSYYNEEGLPAVFWQDADSVFIDQILYNKNIILKRDSSYGGGKVLGNLVIPFKESDQFDGISVFAKSIDNGTLYSYNFVQRDGYFRVGNLPYGRYQLIAQKIGYPFGYSEPFLIDSLNQNVNNISIIFNTSSAGDSPQIPETIILYQNFPNPFNPSTVIRWQISTNSIVKLKVFDILGNEVANLINDEMSAGVYELTFNADNLPSGFYFYQLSAGDFIKTRKMILIK